MADNISVKDATGATQTVRMKDVSGVKVPTAMLVDATGSQQINEQSKAASIPVALPNDQALIGRGIVTPGATFTRPSNTTPYASGQLVGNSVTAASVTPLSFTAARFATGGFRINAAIIAKSSVGTSGATFRVHLFDSAPTIASGDGAAFSTTGAGNGSSPTWLGSVDVTITQVFTDGAMGRAAIGPPSNFIKKGTGQTIVALIEARGAYTPTSAEVFTVILEIEQA